MLLLLCNGEDGPVSFSAEPGFSGLPDLGMSSKESPGKSSAATCVFTQATVEFAFGILVLRMLVARLLSLFVMLLKLNFGYSRSF